MKKVFFLLSLLSLTFVSSMAKEYAFKLTPNDDSNIDCYVSYDTSTKKFSLKTVESSTLDLVMGMFFGIPVDTSDEKEEVIVYDNEPNVSLYHSTANQNWGGNANELLFIDPEGYILFGAYIDPVKFDYDDRRKSYIVLPTKEGIEKFICCAVLKENYEPFDALLALSRSVDSYSSDSPSSAASSAASSATQKDSSFLQYILKPAARYSVLDIKKWNWSKIEKTLKADFGNKSITVQKLSSPYRIFYIQTKSVQIAGKSPDFVDISKDTRKPLSISYTYTFLFDTDREALSFSEILKNKVQGSCGDILRPVEKRDGEKWPQSFIGDYEYGGLDYSVHVMTSTWGDDKFSSNLIVHLFFHDK